MVCKYSVRVYAKEACSLTPDAPWCKSRPEKCEIYKFRGLVDGVYEELETAVPEIIIYRLVRHARWAL